jgi:uncharacterized protein YukE
MALVGMDTDLAHSQLSQLQHQGIDAIQAVMGQLDALLGQIVDNWKGQDALNFHNEYNSSLRTQLNNIHTALSEFASVFNQNISDQIATSSH